MIITHSVGWHSDADKETDKNHCIASLSIGATRLFEVWHLFRQHQYTLPMTHGMLLIMQGAFQSEFEHRVPADDRYSEYRINLAFKKLIWVGLLYPFCWWPYTVFFVVLRLI